MNQQTNREAFEKTYPVPEGIWYHKDGDYINSLDTPNEYNNMWHTWQAALTHAKRQPLKRLSDEDVDSYILNKGHLDCMLDFSAEHDDVTELKTELRRLVKAIMDEMERINHE